MVADNPRVARALLETPSEWVSHNVEWLLSGIGVSIPLFLISILLTRRQKKEQAAADQSLTVADHSAGIQAGRDIRVRD